MKVSNVVSLIVPVAIVLTVATAPAHAHGAGGACRQDVQALCPNVTPGPGSFRDCLKTLCPDITSGPGSFGACLKQHESQLSAACQQHLSRVAAKLEAVRQACQPDVQSFCSDVTPGHGAIIKCLRQHKGELSQTCKEQLHKLRRWRHHHHTPTAAPDSAPSKS